MKISFSEEAIEVLRGLEVYVENINTKGSGRRFIKRFKNSLKTYIQPNITYKLCNNEFLKDAGFSCIPISNWVIVFKIENNIFKVYDIIWGPLLT